MMLTRAWLGVLVILFCVPELGRPDPLGIKLGLNLEEKYNDNVFFEKDDTQNDFITRIGPWLQGGWETEITDFQLRGRVDYYNYRDNDGLDAVDQSYDSSLFRSWSPRFSTTLSVAYLDDERRERELAETGLLFNDDKRRRYTYGIVGQYQLSEISTASISYNYQIEDFDDELTYDFTSHSVQLAYARDMSSIVDRSTGRVVLVGGYYEYQRDFSTTDPLFGVFDANVKDEQSIEYYSLRLGLSHNRTERLKLDLEMGARYTRNERTQDFDYETTPFFPDLSDSEGNESWGYVATLEADYSGEKWIISLLVSHDLVPASGREGTTERTTFRFRGSRRIGSDWYADGSASAFLNRSDDSNTANEEDELTLKLHAGLHYAFNSNWSLGAYWQTNLIDDRIDGENKTQSTISLRLKWEYSIFE